MHPVVKSHLSAFARDFGIEDLAESKIFEAFVNYCIISTYYYGQINPDDHIYSGDDPGIDGIIIIIDGDLVSSADEADTIFSRPKKNMEVKICFTQAKSGENRAKSDINTFESAVIDFLHENSEYPMDEYLKDKKKIFNAVISNLSKIKSGKPDVSCYYATGASGELEREIQAAISTFQNNITRSGYFQNAQVIPLDRDDLVKLWMRSSAPIETTLTIIAAAHFPPTDGINESYVISLSANEFIKKVLVDQNGNLKKGIFDENVRAFLGINNPVNDGITETLKDTASKKRFGILNNGITIISPNVRLQSNSLFMEQYQIVNGCQTSNVLYENMADINNDVTLTIKVIETTDSVIIDEIVKSTNSQTKVEDHQFLATLDTVKKIERYFIARAEPEEHKLFFARRQNQYAQDDITRIRVFDIKELCRCAGSMFFARPDLATRYPTQLIDELSKDLFAPANREEIYYTSAFSLYRIGLHFNNNRLPNQYRKFKWYILMLIRMAISRGKTSNTNTKGVEKECKKIYHAMKSNDDHFISSLNLCCQFMDSFVDITSDKIKRHSFVQEVQKAFHSKIKEDNEFLSF